jgi:NAD-dependent dihydropyrimidine dehydrogenase PreA subunit
MSDKIVDEKFAKWNGIDRLKIKWNPKIDTDKCIGCGMCVTSCGRDVFRFNYESRKAVVQKPYNCLVGCTSCESWCVAKAISFPDKEYVRDIIKKDGLAAKSVQEVNSNKSRYEVKK